MQGRKATKEQRFHHCEQTGKTAAFLSHLGVLICQKLPEGSAGRLYAVAVAANYEPGSTGLDGACNGFVTRRCPRVQMDTFRCPLLPPFRTLHLSQRAENQGQVFADGWLAEGNEPGIHSDLVEGRT